MFCLAGCFVLNQEKKDLRISRILSTLKSFLSWFKTIVPSFNEYPILSIIASFLSWFKTTNLVNHCIHPFPVQDQLPCLNQWSKTNFPHTPTLYNQSSTLHLLKTLSKPFHSPLITQSKPLGKGYDMGVNRLKNGIFQKQS